MKLATLPPRRDEIASQAKADQARRDARMKAENRALLLAARALMVTNRFEAGQRWQWGDRSYLWSYVTDARFDANQATRYEMVRRIRYFEENSPLVQRLCDVFEQYVVGANGLILSPDSSDENWNLAAKDWWDEWGIYPDLVSLQNWAILQSLIARTWFIDGEVFILLTRSENPPYRPRIQLFEGHRVGTPPSLASQEGKTIVDGVEIDWKGRPVAYWIQTGLDAREYTRIDAQYIIHIFEPSRIGMYRGITHFYAVLNTLHDLDDLARMEMMKAKDAAETTGIIKTPTGEVVDDATEFDREIDSADPWAQQGQQNPLAEYYKRIFGPTKKVMKIGDEYENAPPVNNPTTAQQWYWRYIAEQICNGVSIPITLVYPDSIQGTVLRAVMDAANAQFRSRSSVLGAAFKRVWAYVIGTGSTQDRRISGKPADWLKLGVRAPRAVNVDVGRNSSAMLAEWLAGVRTLRDICAETGDDWKDIIAQKAREIAAIKKVAKDAGVEPNEVSDAIAPMEPPSIAAENSTQEA